MTVPIDLHLHSTFSDGVRTPEELCELALSLNMEVIALCDHDTTEGLAPMADSLRRRNSAGKRLRCLPSVELSTGAEGRTHLLGYGVNAENPALQRAIHALRRMRAERGRQMVEAMRKLGIEIPAAFLPAENTDGSAIGRPHIARALILMGTVQTVDQAFERYLTAGKPAYVPLEHGSAEQGVEMLRAAGAVPVLAHPVRIGLSQPMLESLITSLQARGLGGVEVYHPSASRRDIRMLEAIADRHGLLVTGGSDFHGDRGTRARMGGLPGNWRNWANDFDLLEQAIQQTTRA